MKKRKVESNERAKLTFSNKDGWASVGPGFNVGKTYNGLPTINRFGGIRNYDVETIEDIIQSRDVTALRQISRHFASTSGTYGRVLRYLAYLPTYDYILTPTLVSDSARLDRMDKDFSKISHFFERMNLQSQMKDIVYDTLVDGAYFGYLRQTKDNVVLQKLPVEYCRSQFKLNGFPAVEFNVKYFDETFPMTQTRLKVLKSFPPEIVEGYNLYKQGLIPLDTLHNNGAWVLLDSENTCMFSFTEDTTPLLVNVVPTTIRLKSLGDIDLKTAEQNLLHLMIQKVPLTKEGDFIFDMEEAKVMHKNATQMMNRADNMDVLTTFADVEMHDLSNKNKKQYDLPEWQKSVYNEMGVSPQLFATEGNLALEKSILVDAALVFYLVGKVKDWWNYQLDLKFNKTKSRHFFRFAFLPITESNRVEFAKLYKDFATLGYSKQLPAIALGQSQLNFLSMLRFENEVLNLGELMEPLQSSYTASSKGEGGRPKKDATEKSDKTIANEASQ